MPLGCLFFYFSLLIYRSSFGRSNLSFLFLSLELDVQNLLMNLLEVRKLSKAYSAHKALQDVSLAVPQGSIYGLLGPNGAGKTTLIRIITQILMPDAGEVWLKGEPLQPEHVREIGYLPEERGLYKKMKVGEQLEYLGRLKGLPHTEARRLTRQWLERLELLPWGGKHVEDLSKGMQQKVQFIATVMHQPKLIILDEPFSGFDPLNATLIRDEILQLRDNGSTIIFSTHRMESVEELCDHIALINKSRKILEGSKKDIKNQFRNNTFVVEHRGHLNGQLQGADLLGQLELEPGMYRSTLQSRSETPNLLLKELIDSVEVHRFEEKIPSINEIFIAQVKETSHA
jgi:ABC-2 type transport system ATP-binding protein